MPGIKETSKYKKKRRGFNGIQNQNMTRSTDEAPNSTINSGQIQIQNTSPDKLNRSHDKIERNCPLKIKERANIFTRKRAFSELGIDNTNSKGTSTSTSPPLKRPCYGNKIIDSSLLQAAISSSAICKNCRNTNSKLILKQDNSKRYGLNEALSFHCSICNAITYMNTSQKINHASDINLRLTQCCFATGTGLTAISKMCTTLNLPPPASKRTYRKNMEKISNSSFVEAQKPLQQSAKNVKCVLKVSNVDFVEKDIENDIFDCSVSVDGTWQKRYGFSSLLGVVYLISMETGEVLDYDVKSKICFECKARMNWDKTSERYKNYKNHESDCSINHVGSAGEMEKAAAVTMFLRSIEKHNLRYTVYVGDGDSSSFGEVKDALNKKFKDSYPLTKEDCQGHIQKRMGTNLRSYKNKVKGKVLSDGCTVGGKGRLTDATIDTFQNYYGAAIRQNQNDLESMKSAIWAIYYHTILGNEKESLDQQHQFCPKTVTTWCRYQSDKINNTSTYNQDHCLPNVFRKELKYIFDRLCEENLLKRCLRGYTQNQNESINNLLWSKCPKRIFCGKSKLETATAQAVITWNMGSAGQGEILKNIGFKNLGVHTIAGYRKENDQRIYHAKLKVSSTYRKRRQYLRHDRKKKKTVTKDYKSGGFSTKKVPDKLDFTVNIVQKTVEANNVLDQIDNIDIVQLKFISDNDVGQLTVD